MQHKVAAAAEDDLVAVVHELRDALFLVLHGVEAELRLPDVRDHPRRVRRGSSAVAVPQQDEVARRQLGAEVRHGLDGDAARDHGVRGGRGFHSGVPVVKLPVQRGAEREMRDQVQPECADRGGTHQRDRSGPAGGWWPAARRAGICLRGGRGVRGCRRRLGRLLAPGCETLPGSRDPPVKPGGPVRGGADQNDHEEGVVVEGGLPPVRRRVGEHALEQERDRRDRDRGQQREEAERPEQPEHGVELDPRRDEQLQGAGRMGDHVPRGLRHIAAEGRVRPVEVGLSAERRDQDVGRDPRVRDPAHDQKQAHQPLPGHDPVRHRQVGPDPGDEQAHILLHQEQQPERDQRPAQPARLESLQRHSHQHRRERDLMKLEDQRRGERPAHRVGHGNEVRGHDRLPPAAERPAGEHPDRGNGQREQHRLRHEQGDRGVEDPVHRRERRENWRPMVAEQGVVGAEPQVVADERRYPEMEVRIRAHGLVKDQQVVG